MKLTDDQIEQIESWAEKGKSGQWISGQLSLKPATVCYRMLLAGFDPWPGKRNGNHKQRGGFSPEEDAQMLELGKTLSVYKISKLMGRPYTSIRIRLMTLEVRAEKALAGAA